MLGDAFEHTDRNPPQQGIAPDLSASAGLASSILYPLSSIP